jgi:hypothetical protein
LQSRSREDYISYKKLRAEVRKLSRTIKRPARDKFVKSLEHDVTGAQRIEFKTSKNLKMKENDRLKLNLIPKDAWKKHYTEVWKTETTVEENTEAEDDEIDENTEEISQEELEAKNRKSPRLDNISMELFKYGGNRLKNNLLALLNHIWQSRRIPKDWVIGLVINVHKKGNANNCRNYRGITLLSTASKLYANTLRNKLNK